MSDTAAKPRRVLLVGWDAADWKVIRPLLAGGAMPNLARLLEGGSSGNLATLQPPLSPMLWTSIATGKRPSKHGIYGFTEPLPDGSGVRPVTTLGRKTKAVWNILNQNGLTPAVVGWWPSHPAEPLRGVMVSNHFNRAGQGERATAPVRGLVHPPSWTRRLAELRISPVELPGEAIRLFVPEYDRIDQSQDKRLHTLGKILAETWNIHAAATEVLEHSEWDFAAVYYDAIDHFSHAFMAYHPPRMPRISEEDFSIFRQVIATAYSYHDAMLGRLLELAGPGTTVIVMSDHGFHPDGLRPAYIPAEAAGPAVEHRGFGILCMHGPGVRTGATIHGASVLDVTPTLLHLFGLPVGQDMDGRVLATALTGAEPVATIPTWDDVPGDAGTHPPEVQVDAVASAEAMKQLVALGYVAPPGEDMTRTVAETVAELRYNLAQSYDDARRPDLSLPLYEELHAGDPADRRFVDRRIQALLKLNRPAEARTVLDGFDVHCAATAPEARAELERRRRERPDAELRTRTVAADAREGFERRALAERATGLALQRGMMRVRVDLAEGRRDEAGAVIRGLEAAASREPARRLPPLTMAQSYVRLGDAESARAWIARALERDPEDWQALALRARLEVKCRRFHAALADATASLQLIFFQPPMHYLAGRCEAAMGRFEAAAEAFRIAISQMPGHVPAVRALARLYQQRLDRPGEAALLRERAAELVRKARERRDERSGIRTGAASGGESFEPASLPRRDGTGNSDPSSEIVIVSGLPRSGTSMLMQLLAAGGVTPLTDERRTADEDNPRGYFELEAATALLRDASWLPHARGKAVKLVLPLLTSLPTGERYRVIVIEREEREVIASQRSMLERLGRTDQAAKLDEASLAVQYRALRDRVRRWLEERSDVAVMAVAYADVLADPAATAAEVGRFLGRPFDPAAAARAVEPGLRRQGANGG